MMMQRRGLGDDTPLDAGVVSLDVGQVATWGWYGVALALGVLYVLPKLFGGKKGARKRRK